MESCVNAVRRSYSLLDRIKSEKESPVLPRELRRSIEGVRTPIKHIRNAAEHMDGLIQKGETAPGQPIMLSIGKNGDSIIISKYEMKFEELATALKNIHEIALYILTNKEIEAA